MIAELDRIAEDSLMTFGNLSAEQINWKLRADNLCHSFIYKLYLKKETLYADFRLTPEV